MKAPNKARTTLQRRRVLAKTKPSAEAKNGKINKELALTRKVSKGDLDALDVIVTSYLEVVEGVAGQFINQGLSLDELVYIGNIGLIKAARRFDEKKETTFENYCKWWIRQSIVKALQEQARIELVPDCLIHSLWEITIKFDAEEFRNDREPSNSELREIVNLKIDEIRGSSRC